MDLVRTRGMRIEEKCGECCEEIGYTSVKEIISYFQMALSR